MHPPPEQFNLDALVHTYDIDHDYEQFKRLEFLHKLQSYIPLEKAAVLELGPASGQLTRLLSQRARRVVAVEGSSAFLEQARRCVGDCAHVQFELSYFEDFHTTERFDCIVLQHVLEHIREPEPVLRRLASFLLPDGLLAVSVPNAYALSRQLAVAMGLLPSVFALSENDRNHGHYRIYDWSALEHQLAAAGYVIIGRHGLYLKLLSDRQQEQMLQAKIMGEQQIKGLWTLADQYRDIAGGIMVIAKPGPLP
ncbi:MAG: class I SAM-dependent methyltransferase [Chitinophagales bacterium]|nr:class I SAM-dependent methyltransferase [Chitinophagales bacterium]MDW8394369.1 class I SAM-dependent methyltransferase [Chitinophagales bacterium]